MTTRSPQELTTCIKCPLQITLWTFLSGIWTFSYRFWTFSCEIWTFSKIFRTVSTAFGPFFCDIWTFLKFFWVQYKGIARTQSPTNKNCAPESPTFGVIAAVSPTGVQWKGLTLGEPPNGSRYPLCQVSMLDPRTLPGFYLRIHNKTVSLFNSVCIFNHHVIIFSKLYITAISNACWRKHMLAVYFSV